MDSNSERLLPRVDSRSVFLLSLHFGSNLDISNSSK